MKGQIAVLGIGRFGFSLASTLYEMGYEVMAMDTDEKRIQAISPYVTHAVQGDVTSETVLRDLDIGEFEIAVVAAGSMIETSVLATILLKKLGVPYVIARAVTDLHGEILQKIGADQVVFPQRDMGRRVAHGITIVDVVDYMSITKRYGVSKIPALPFLAGKDLAELGFGKRGERKVAVLLIQRGKQIIISPHENEVVVANDVLVIAANDNDLEELLAEAKKKP
jgi:trk system potassium uptake protein TrkA